MTTKFTCFVISPIGEPNSEIRAAADETFEYIIKPALDKFDFIVERADHIRGITDTITKEMVERIKRSDLCIVELTGLNPNVMYECGRRHETDKPCILISRDELLPFDVVTHPVVRYSLDGDAKEVIKTIRIIQQNVQHFVDLGFERSGNRTLTDVYREVGTVGQKVDILLKRLTTLGPAQDATNHHGKSGNDANELVKKLGGVIAAINFALANRDTDLLDQLLPRVPKKTSENFVQAGLVQGAFLGSRAAFEMLEPIISGGMAEFDWEQKSRIIGGYAAGASRLDEEGRALPIVRAITEEMTYQIEQGSAIAPKPQAVILNALQRLYHGLAQYDNAIRIGAKILELDSDEESYLFNQSLNCQAGGDHTGAITLVDRFVTAMRNRGFTDSDDDHLVHAIRTYLKVGRLPDARELFLVLEDQHPLKAQILRGLDDFDALFE